MKPSHNSRNATSHLPFKKCRNDDDAVLPQRTQNTKGLFCSVKNHHSSVPFLHRDGEEVHVDNAVPVQVHMYAYVEV